MTFEMWMKRVNELVIDTVGLCVDDLADFPFRDYYKDGASVLETVEDLLYENDYDGAALAFDEADMW